MIESTYSDIIVNGIEINKNSDLFTQKDAVTKSYVDYKVAALIDSAPQVLDTLNELSNALGGDANFSTTISTQLSNIQKELDIITQKIEDQKNSFDLQLQNKLDSGDKYLKNTDGNFKINDNSYLYLGDSWRITANNSTLTKRLEFQYSQDGGLTWTVGFPFIRSS